MFLENNVWLKEKKVVHEQNNKMGQEIVVGSCWWAVYGKRMQFTGRRPTRKRPNAALIFHILIRAKYFHWVKY